jgi:hypothetical protein
MLCPICSDVLESKHHWHAIDKYDVEYDTTGNNTMVWFFSFHSKGDLLLLRLKNIIPLTLERIEQLFLLK